MGRSDTYFGDCKSPYSRPADCKSAGTGGLIDDKPEQGLARREWQAVYRENVLREELGFPLRTYYQTKSSLVKIVNEFNLPIHPYWY